MKNIQRVAGFVVVIGAVFGFVISSAHAMSPSLDLSQISNNAVSVDIYGDANSQIYLYYSPNNSYSNYQSVGTIGTTDNNGDFSSTLYLNNYSIPSGSTIYVMVDNQNSSSVTWPYYNGNYYSNNNLSLNSTNVTLSVGQTVTINSSYNNSNLYVSSNSNSSVATASSNGNTVSIYGNNYGTNTLNICDSNDNCQTVYVTVQGNNYYNSNSTLTLSSNSVTMNPGQNQTVTVSSAYAVNFSVTSSNTSIATASASGNMVTIYGVNNGSTNVVVCQTNNSSNCVNISVTVTGFIYNQMNPPVTPNIVYLSQVPYTGIGSTAKIGLFILALAAWVGGTAYFFIRRKMAGNA